MKRAGIEMRSGWGRKDGIIGYFFEKSLAIYAGLGYNYFCRYGILAQLVEQLTLNQWVGGSRPSYPISKLLGLGLTVFLFASI